MNFKKIIVLSLFILLSGCFSKSPEEQLNGVWICKYPAEGKELIMNIDIKNKSYTNQAENRIIKGSFEINNVSGNTVKANLKLKSINGKNVQIDKTGIHTYEIIDDNTMFGSYDFDNKEYAFQCTRKQ